MMQGMPGAAGGGEGAGLASLLGKDHHPILFYVNKSEAALNVH